MTMKRLVAIPSEAVSEYELSGYSTWLPRYYNPAGMFDEVWVPSPLEPRQRDAYGLRLRPVTWAGFRRILGEIRPDLVRAYGGGWSAEMTCLSRVSGIPVIVSLHDSLEGSICTAVRFADRVFCVSSVVRQNALATGIPGDRLALLPNRVDPQVFRPLDKSKSPPGTEFGPGRYILHVGRQCNQKNPDTLVRALALLPREYRVVFIGRGDAKPYRALARSVGVEDRCSWIEAVPNPELVHWYNWCDCMCTPSRHEGFGIVFIEAAACAAPIITSDIAPMNEYLDHGSTAHLVARYEDPSALASAIRDVCENKDYAHALGQGALKMSAAFKQQTVELREKELYVESMERGARSLSPTEMRSLRKLRRLALGRFLYNRFRAGIGKAVHKCLGINTVTA